MKKKKMSRKIVIDKEKTMIYIKRHYNKKCKRYQEEKKYSFGGNG